MAVAVTESEMVVVMDKMTEGELTDHVGVSLRVFRVRLTDTLWENVTLSEAVGNSFVKENVGDAMDFDVDSVKVSVVLAGSCVHEGVEEFVSVMRNLE